MGASSRLWSWPSRVRRSTSPAGLRTRQQLIDAVKAASGTGGAVVHDQARAGDVRHSQADIERARSTLGFRLVVTFEEGTSRTCACYASAAGSAETPPADGPTT
jgi:nucleoside-diphosphate-sugar epimerase